MSVHRPPSWLSNSTRASSSAPTVVQRPEATLCASLLTCYVFIIVNTLQANRVTDKLTHVHDRIYCCRSGSAADTQAVADIVHYYLQLYTYVSSSPALLFLMLILRITITRQTHGSSPPVSVAAGVFQDICYENKDALSAGIIVAGWDKEAGPSVYNIPLGGGLFRQPWAIGGVLCVCLIFNIESHSSCLQALARHMCTVIVMPHTRMGGDRMRPSIL